MPAILVWPAMRQNRALKQREVSVEGLRLEAGKTVGDGDPCRRKRSKF